MDRINTKNPQILSILPIHVRFRNSLMLGSVLCGNGESMVPYTDVIRVRLIFPS